MMARRDNQSETELTELLKSELNTSKLTYAGQRGGGCISEGMAYDTDSGKVFVKINTKGEAKRMFDGEFASLAAIDKTGVVKVPKPIKVVLIPSGGAALVMENLDLVGGLGSKSAILGEQLARLHAKNTETASSERHHAQSVHGKKESEAVEQFGFHVDTCCGYIAQNNQWASTWEEFYARKLEQQIAMVQEKHSDREAREEWSLLQRTLPKFFTGLHICPALLHGDLWSGNAAEMTEVPVIFDPASFYGHAEYDLAIARMFGGFSAAFFNAYFKVLPKQSGHETRLELYKLFHYLNHWNHFGGGYKQSSMSIFRHLNQVKS